LKKATSQFYFILFYFILFYLLFLSSSDFVKAWQSENPGTVNKRVPHHTPQSKGLSSSKRNSRAWPSSLSGFKLRQNSSTLSFFLLRRWHPSLNTIKQKKTGIEKKLEKHEGTRSLGLVIFPARMLSGTRKDSFKEHRMYVWHFPILLQIP